MTPRASARPRATFATSVLGLLLATGALALGLLYFFWPVFATRMAAVPGDIGDARFIQAILEHWFQVARGAAAWRDPPMFYPVRGVLGFSDGLFLYAVPYVVLRFAGSAPVVAYVVTLGVILATGYAGALWFLGRVLGVRRGIAIVAALTWIFSNLAVVKMVHVNMYAMAFVPLAFGLAWRAVEALGEGRGFSTAGVCLAILMALLLYTSFYMGWFTLLLLAPWAALCGAHRWKCDRAGARAWAAKAWSARWGVAGLAMVFVVCMVPFIATYLPVYVGVQAGRGWREILPLLPRPVDFVNVGPGNLLWGPLANAIPASSHPFAGELSMGLPPGLIAMFLAVLAFELQRLYRACRTGSRPCSTTEIAVTCLGLLVPLYWIAMVRIGDVSLWAAIYALVPGAGAVRAVFRLQMLLQIIMLALICVALDRAWRGHQRRWVVGIVLAVLIVEQWNLVRATYDARAEADRVARFVPPPSTCKFFAIAPGGADAARLHPVITQIDAMEIGRRFELPTVHGYSSLTPPRWDLWSPATPGYAAALVTWLQANRLHEGFCTLDLRDGRWWTPRAGTPNLTGINLIGQDIALDERLAIRLEGLGPREPGGIPVTGEARIVPRVPIQGSRLTVDVTVVNPAGAQVALRVNDTPALERSLGPGRHHVELPLAAPVSRLAIQPSLLVPQPGGQNADARRTALLVERISVDP